ncbi:hypothetical protein [Salinarimonas soli]|uniref:Uncharacterized protein n=1 Tax=Salinarimonas soli TaxID=1638099 RepID=A0A5B2VF21_9HYPH|nr:hypothetical protein [Salinarimonas soli]KAA2236909.1 hypothetical protein F0L46_13040 [Salinarimonas soli]
MPIFACTLCDASAVKPPFSLDDSAPVRCFRCDCVVGTWGDLKDRANRLIALEQAGSVGRRSIRSADPLCHHP